MVVFLLKIGIFQGLWWWLPMKKWGDFPWFFWSRGSNSGMTWRSLTGCQGSLLDQILGCLLPPWFAHQTQTPIIFTKKTLSDNYNQLYGDVFPSVQMLCSDGLMSHLWVSTNSIDSPCHGGHGWCCSARSARPQRLQTCLEMIWVPWWNNEVSHWHHTKTCFP